MRTLEEITYDAWVAVHTPGKLSKEAIFEALREAVAQERTALREWLERWSEEYWTAGGVSKLELLDWLDAREKKA